MAWVTVTVTVRVWITVRVRVLGSLGLDLGLEYNLVTPIDVYIRLGFPGLGLGFELVLGLWLVSCYDALCRLNRLWLRMLRFRMLRDVTGTNKLDGTVTVLGILERS